MADSHVLSQQIL